MRADKNPSPPDGLVEQGTNEPEPSSALLERRLPPVAELAVTSVALVLAGGVYLAAHLPKPPPLAPAIGLLAGGGVLTLCALVMLSRIRPFAWGAFFLVARWAFLAYLVIAGLLGFVFVYDHTRGAVLAVLVMTLVVFALDVPMIMSFTVARYQPTGPSTGS
jgi:membrane-bound acyltransferase YfiQ involved in biofilm formation